MRFIIINHFGGMEIIEGEALPRVGDRIDLFFTPSPTVSMVLWYPNENTLARLPVDVGNIDAIITVE